MLVELAESEANTDSSEVYSADSGMDYSKAAASVDSDTDSSARSDSGTDCSKAAASADSGKGSGLDSRTDSSAHSGSGTDCSKADSGTVYSGKDCSVAAVAAAADCCIAVYTDSVKDFRIVAAVGKEDK